MALGNEAAISEEIFEAVREGDLNFLRNVLNRHPDYVNIRDKSWFNRTPLHKASIQGQVDVVKLLLQKGANMNALDDFNETPLHEASRHGQVDVIKLLIQNGANINIADKLNQTPLHKATFQGQVDVVKLLLQKGANVNAVGNNGYTPLHDAARLGMVEAVKVLCEHLADINMTNLKGDTPVHVAAQCGRVEAQYERVEVVKVLCEQGANINMTNDDGDTPMDCARKSKNYETVKVLTEHGALDKATNKESTDDVKREDTSDSEYVAKLKNNYEKKLSAKEAEINQLSEAVKELKLKENEIKVENKMLKRRIEQQRESSKKHIDETVEVEHATDYIGRVKEINQLKDTVSLLKIKEYELETENKKLKLENEQLRRFSKESFDDAPEFKSKAKYTTEDVVTLMNDLEKEISVKQIEINQLKDDASVLKYKHNEVEIENRRLKSRIEKSRESSKYQSKLETENEKLKLEIEQLRKSSKESFDDVPEFKSKDTTENVATLMNDFEKEISAKQIEINQLKDDVSVLKIKQSEVKAENRRLKSGIEKSGDSSKKQLEYQHKLETENEKLKLEIEQLRKSSKLEDTVDTDSSNVDVTSIILKYGSYYVSYEAQYCGKKCVAKKEDVENNVSKKLLKRECKFLLHLNHPCVVQHLAMLNDQKSPVLLMEKMSMSLTEFLTSKQSHHVKISILHDTARGLHYIHDKGVIHSDLNGDNILLTKNVTAKLADFGRANFCQQHMKYLPETLHHLPPEIFEPYSKANYSTKVDVFSFGCVIIHTFTQERPIPDLDKYVETSEGGKYKKHSEVERRLVCIKKIKKDVNAIKFYDILLKCLQDNPDHRPTIATLLSFLDEQLVTNLTNFFKFVDDMHLRLLFESEKYKTSFNWVLVKRLKLLTTLSVSGCNITKQGADMMATVLLNTVSLTKLDLSNTMLNSTRANKVICALKNISSLKVLNINNNDIDDEAADGITAILCSNHLLEHVDLSHNKLSYTGVLNIANSLSENIKKIDISSNFIASDDVVDLAAALSKCPLLQELNISYNLLKLTGVLTIARFLRHHPTLKILDLSNNTVSFSSACEFIVDVILSVNKTLVNLNVCGRNIRPRYVEDYLSPPHSEDDTDNFTLQNLYLLKHSLLNVTNTEANVIKVTETCPISSTNIISYHVDHLGGVFYNRYNNFAVVIPPGAVSQGDCVEIQATANYSGPYIIPEGFYPISSYYWVSANYEFKAPVYFVMNHYAKITCLEDINKLHVLHKCARDPDAMNEGLSTIPDGVYFDKEIGYCVLATNHFCTYCGTKSDKGIPEYLTACYYTYDESSSGKYIAEVAFFPSNYNCKKLVEEQCNKRNTEIKRSVTFDVVNGEQLYISSIDLSRVNDHEWMLIKTGKSNIIHLRDFEFWKIFYGLTEEEIRKREESFDYPPRLCIECVHIDSSKPLYSSFKVSKKHNNSIIGEFSLIKQVTESVQAPLPAPLQAPLQHRTAPLQHRIFSRKPLMRDLNKIVVPKVSAEWEDIAFELDYEISVVNQISEKHKEDPKKCCKELFKDWLETSNGVEPKIWLTLLDKLKEIEKLHSITKDIIEKLIQMDI